MILPDKYYQVIKWTVLTVLPAASALVAMLGKAYGWNGTDMTVLTINAVATFLGVITGVSAYNLKNRRKQMKKKITITAMSLLTALFLLPINGFAYTINNEFNLGPNEGSSQVANNQYILLHETANETATGRNEAQYMQRSWTSAYTAYIVGDGGIVYQVGQPGYVQYGAGSYANANSPVQIELQHTHDKATFEKNYKAYVELARDSAKKYGIPLTLDTPYNQPGIKSHLWVTQNIWGDHTDPYGYLSEMGVSKEKLAYDLAHGFTDDNPTTSEDKPVIDPTRAGAVNPTLTDGTNYAHIDQFGEIENANLHVAGWHIANYKYEYIFIMDYNTGKELARVKADGVYRPDVNQAYNTSGNVGYHVSFNMRNFPNKKVYVMMRATNDPEGNTKGGAQDFHDKRWYLNIPQR